MPDRMECPFCHRGQVLCIEVQGVYDGGLIWECGSCRRCWPRFAEGRLYAKAMEIIGAWEANGV